MRTFAGRALGVAALVATCVAPARAGDLQLTISNGRVTLIADNVPARQILEAWAKVGDSQVLNADKLAGPPLTLRLEDVSEREALNVVLRSAAGFLVAPRPGGEAGASRFDRIVVLATSTPPPAPARSMAPPPPAPFAQPPVDLLYQPDEPPPDEIPQQLQPYPGPFPGTVVPQQEPAAPTQPQTSPRPGFLPTPPQPQQPVLTLPPGYPGVPPPTTPRKPGGGGGR